MSEKAISVQELKTQVALGLPNARLIDVRSPEEFAGGAIPLAINIPLSQLASHLAELKQTSRLYVVCHSGGRSLVATIMLKAAGCKHVLNVTGGTAAWLAANTPA